jgi:cytochrome b involved in lipid metabolism
MGQKSNQSTGRKYTREEVAKNNTADSLWSIIDHKVYDLTDFLDAHPGGSVVLTQIAGSDATTDFYNLHSMKCFRSIRTSASAQSRTRSLK